MLKLKLEEITNKDSQRSSHSSPVQLNTGTGSFLIALDGKQIIHLCLYRGDVDRVNAYMGSPLADVHHYEFRAPKCTHTYLKIDDRTIPSRQGTFRFKEDGTTVYENECNHGTLLIPATSTGQSTIHGEYAIKPGDQFLLGFPKSSHRFKATIVRG